MKKLLIIGCYLLVSLILHAHPGIGIVKDSKGNIFYTDLKQVWKLTPDGSRIIAVKEVHTHELYIDGQDNLYGEHLWYNGESKDTWGHYVWCLKSNGELVKEIEPKEGFLTNYSFVRDSAGNMYWVERFTTSRIMKKSITGEVSKLVEDNYGFIGWLFSTKNGTLYFTENNRLHRLLPNGKLETLAENIGNRSTKFTMMGRNYDSYGIWTDSTNNIYLAMPDARKVVRVDNNGKLETVVSSNSTWMVTGGVFDNRGNLWLLEHSVTNEVRVRRIDQQSLAVNKTSQTGVSRMHLWITFFTAVAIVILFVIVKLMIKGTYNKENRYSF